MYRKDFFKKTSWLQYTGKMLAMRASKGSKTGSGTYINGFILLESKLHCTGMTLKALIKLSPLGQLPLPLI